jgi:hypothetical protein
VAIGVALFALAIEVLGVERILFSINYPYRFTSSGGARRFSEEADLSAADKAAIAQGNWERLTENTQRGSQRASSAGRIGGLRFRWSL